MRADREVGWVGTVSRSRRPRRSRDPPTSTAGAGGGGQALATGRAVEVPRYRSAPFARDLVELVAGEEGIGSLVAVPVSFGGEVRLVRGEDSGSTMRTLIPLA